LADWIRLGDLPDNLYPLPNVLLTPLVVIFQLTQYSNFLKQLYPDITPDEQLPYTYSHSTETVGLCTGLLSAAAVASSRTLRELASHGAVAVRLAMALGAVVDAGDDQTDSREGHWQSFAVAWHSPIAGAEFTKAMDACPKVSIGGPLFNDCLSLHRLISLSHLVRTKQRLQFVERAQSRSLPNSEPAGAQSLKPRYVVHFTPKIILKDLRLSSNSSTRIQNSTSPALLYLAKPWMPGEENTSTARVYIGQ
jgi:hypothetical protein